MSRQEALVYMYVLMSFGLVEPVDNFGVDYGIYFGFIYKLERPLEVCIFCAFPQYAYSPCSRTWQTHLPAQLIAVSLASQTVQY